MQKNSKPFKPDSRSLLNCKTIKFDKGPKVLLSIERGADGELIGCQLQLRDSFICSGADPLLLDWLSLYVQGRATPLSLASGTPFQREVIEAMKQIPFGQVKTYGELAQICGRPRAARAVGGACKQNAFPLLVPCHRVIPSSGKLGGFACGLEIKRRLLEFEAR